MMWPKNPVPKKSRRLDSIKLWAAESKPWPAQGHAGESPGTHLHDPMADGTILSLPQHHQADDYDRRNGHCNHQQANKGTAAQTEVLPQWPHGFLK